MAYFEQEWNEEQVRRELEGWQSYWNKGTDFGIVGGNKLRSSITPNTVIGQARLHGEPEVSRKGTTSFEGLGELVTAIEDLLTGEVTQTEINEFYEKHKRIKEIIGDDNTNPANIPFTTIVEFSKPEAEGDEPIVTRAEVFGHYRTQAYNDYMEWDNEANDAAHKIAETKEEWYNKSKNEANPPLLQCIMNKDRGILAVVRITDKALGGRTGKNIKHKKGTIGAFPVLGKPPEQLANISTMREHVEQILNDPSIYPRGKQRAPVKERLNAAFNERVFTADTNDIRILEELFIDFKDMPGHQNLKQFKLYFPKSNITINKLIRTVLGDDIDTFQKPGTTPEEVKPGLTLKMDKSWKGVLRT